MSIFNQRKILKIDIGNTNYNHDNYRVHSSIRPSLNIIIYIVTRGTKRTLIFNAHFKTLDEYQTFYISLFSLDLKRPQLFQTFLSIFFNKLSSAAFINNYFTNYPNAISSLLPAFLITTGTRATPPTKILSYIIYNIKCIKTLKTF